MRLEQDHPRTTRFPFALRIVRAWVKLYTLGLPSATKRERRSEVDADIWEQWGQPSAQRSTEVLVRCLRGIPDDVIWRVVDARESQSAAEGRFFMDAFMAQSRSSRLTTLLMVVLVVGAAVFTIFYADWYDDPSRGDTTFYDAVWPWATLFFFFFGLGLISSVGGLIVAKRSRWAGMAITLGGVWMLALSFFWLLYIPIVLAAVLTFFMVWRASKGRAGRS